MEMLVDHGIQDFADIRFFVISSDANTAADFFFLIHDGLLGLRWTRKTASIELALYTFGGRLSKISGIALVTDAGSDVFSSAIHAFPIAFWCVICYNAHCINLSTVIRPQKAGLWRIF
jgi:hypothetical protein